MRPDTSSHTANLVARSLLLASKDEALARLLAPGSAAVLARIPEVSAGCFGTVVNWRWVRCLMLAFERLALPGIIAHYLARKLQIEAEVRNALASGSRRVVVIGAGFDTLAWRLHTEYSEVRWVEVDHPATQAVKVRALGEAPNLTCIGYDLAYPVRLAGMIDQTADSAGSTVVVIEGVTMYLPEEKVRELLADCLRIAGPQGRVILTAMERDLKGSIAFRGQTVAVRWWLRFRNEPFLWGISKTSLESFAAGCGAARVKVVDHEALRQSLLAPQGLRDIPLAEGEYLCICFPTDPRP